MKRSFSTTLALAVLTAASSAACGWAARSTSDMYALAERNRRPHSPADARFMTSMIPHHAQAVLFAGWSESHGASRAVRVFSARMVVAQRDEIVTMRTWLGDHGEPVPPEAYIRLSAGDRDQGSVMPGMLTEEQLAELDEARGADFDRAFLTYMIPHHEGALSMVDQLFDSFGGAQDDFVFKLASDIYADQTTEIEHMREMLAAYPPARRRP